MGHSWSLNTAEFDYRWDIVRSGTFQRNAEQPEAMILWLARYISADGELAEWVTTPRYSRVSIWHFDKLIHPTGALDIGLIRDEANMVPPRKEPQVEVPPLGADLADTVGKAQGGDPSIPDHNNTVPTSFFQATSMAPSSSRSIPQLGAVVVPLARLQKLEAQMATLLHHIQPWMQKSIVESEARIERRIEGMMDQKVQTFNKCLDAFELRVLERPTPTIDLSSFQFELASLRTNVDAILAAPTVEPQAALTALADDTMLDTLFSTTVEEGLEPTHAKGLAIEPNFSKLEDEQPLIHRQNRLRDRPQSTPIRVTSAATPPTTESVSNLAPPSVASALPVAPPSPRLLNRLTSDGLRTILEEKLLSVEGFEGRPLHSALPYQGLLIVSSLDDLKGWLASMISDITPRWFGVEALIEKRDMNIASRYWFGFINNTIIPSQNESILRHPKAACLGSIMARRRIDLGILVSQDMPMRSK
ncbi:hypothetical protein H5410_030978 [Solanum commersonii]|uniref:Putative plant transposon protein domain-containing protein n=1 Tax=Solanum commersonii TaxID=4109 RepID=A0A9J5YIY0_SOLCO|nr:hypothetical protein H5410_030978 [Solanum commersonii]